VLPDAPDAATFWANCKQGRYSINEVPKDRWDPEMYWDPDPKAPDKTYSKIGGWVREWEWKPLEWRLPLPPKVDAAMDRTQKWALAAARQALLDYGHPERALDSQRTAVILGNAMAGEQHYRTVLRISFPEIAHELADAPSFASLPDDVRRRVLEEMQSGFGRRLPQITEDTMPGELANIIAGRIANLFDFHGPNFVCDAACASAMAALDAAIEGLEKDDFDAVVTGGVDANMSAATYTKFCKIGALSATGTRPYADGADGFVMGEGAAVFVLKRLADAERDGDRIYAVIRGLAGSSDGRGKGITAPNPVGQRLAVERAWRNAGITPNRATMIEGHGTSTRVGDVVEVESLSEVFRHYGFSSGTLPLGSVKSNLGHLKGAAGAAGMLKAVLALDEKQLPPSLGFERPNPNIDFANSPFYVNRELRPWRADGDDLRRAGVSAFGFGGTNFHLVLEEYVPGRSPAITARHQAAVATAEADGRPLAEARPPLRGVLLLGADSEAELRQRLQKARDAAELGSASSPAPPEAAALAAPWRLALDYQDADQLAAKAGQAATALDSGQRKSWNALASRGIYLGTGAAPKVAFLYTGQGSQYVNMLRDLRDLEPVVAETFAEADAVMEPLLGRPLSELICVASDDKQALAEADELLRQTAITQPAVLTVDVALTRLLATYSIVPDMVMGHSLGEYGALVAAGCLDFDQALIAVSARGNEMTRVSVEDNGKMAAVFAPLETIESILESVDGYVVVANVNSSRQAVIGGGSDAVDRAMEAMRQADLDVRPLPVSHAFHTAIVAPAGEPLRRMMRRLRPRPPRIPVITNVTGDFYPDGPDSGPAMVDLLGQQIASPVQFVQGLETLYRAGARLFVEVGPKRALQGFASDVLGDRHDVTTLATNHPRLGDVASFNSALCGFWAAGLGAGVEPPAEVTSAPPEPARVSPVQLPEPPPATAVTPAESALATGGGAGDDARLRELGDLITQTLIKGFELYAGGGGPPAAPAAAERPVVITGAALGLPGGERVFDDANVARILAGEQFLGPIPAELREAMVRKNITRLVKSEHGDGRFETIGDAGEVIKLAARRRQLDLVEEFGYPKERLAALDITSQLAIGAGLDALRDAGLPLARAYRTTTKGTLLPDRWLLPEALRDDTGVIFASAFPGIDYFAGESRRYYRDRARRERVAELEALRSRVSDGGELAAELDRRLAAARAELEENAYTFDRRFLFCLLSMGHSQFAELIGARGPNTQVNSACASTTLAVGVAEDWIRRGRCRRVVIVSADDVTSDNVLEWIGAGFLASGAAAIDERIEDAAIPFDRRRHGMLIGMGAAAMVVESAEAAAERGLRPIAEVLATATANSAYHGTRLDVRHICGVMESLVATAEREWGIDRRQIAGETVFVSHETYTPARGGSAQAEVDALRQVFGADADKIVVANTKGFTGHPMAVGIEDVVAIKTLETGQVPPVANFRDVDPDLGRLNLSRGGSYPVRYALRLGAGFGSQISLSLMRWVPSPDGSRPAADALGYASRIADPAAWQAWLSRIGDGSGLEVANRTLRLVDGKRTPAAPAGVAAAAPPPAPLAAEVATAPAPAPPPSGVTVDPVQEKVLAIVAEQTGYPPEMLDLDLDLEADLGVDTVKQAETFAAIRAAWDIPRDDNLALRDYPTLAHAIQFVYDRRPDLRSQATGAASAAATADQGAATPTVASEEAEPGVYRRVPTALLRPPIELCLETGVSLDAEARVVVCPDQGGVAAALRARLEKLGVEVLELDAADPEAVAAQLAEWLEAGPIRGVYWLPALDRAREIAEMTPEEWQAAIGLRVKLLYATMRALYEAVAEEGSFLLSATRLGGRHGFDEEGAWAPLGGAVTGFTKAFKRERPDALVKAVDFAPSRKTAALADRLIDETLRDSGVVEVGYRDGRRWTVGLSAEEAGCAADDMQPGAETVYVVTGAAGSIVSAIVTDLAATGGLFHLLDIAPEPDPDDPDLRRFAADRDGLKPELFERIKAGGERPTPAKVERLLAGLERQHAALAAIQAIERSGGRAVYHQVDLLDAEAVAEVVGQLREAHERVDVVVHAAGLEISRMLPDKQPAEFDLVFDVKTQGYFNLMRALGEMDLGAVVAFSSIAGRFGNAGQTDYASANDLLAKLCSSLRNRRAGTRGIAIDWTAWGEIGMATRGSIPQMMAAAGIDMLPPAIGIPVVRQELTAGTDGEVVIGQRLGGMLDEWHPSGGLDLVEVAGRAGGLLSGEIRGMGLHTGLVVETELVPAEQPFLHDHQIDGVPVLPGVMGVEAFAEAAQLLFPERHLTAVEEVRFLAPFKFYRHEPRTLTVWARFRLDGGDVVADCRLLGSRLLPRQSEPIVTEHFAARLRLSAEPAESVVAVWPEAGDGAAVTSAEIYRIYFHGAAYRVVERAWAVDGTAAGLMPASLPDGHAPADASTVTSPRLLELCFQTAGIWELGRSGRYGLPAAIDRVRWLRPADGASGRLCAVIRPAEVEGGFDARVLDESGAVLVVVDGYRTTELPVPLDEAALEPLQAAMA
jgi:acyl transferase domain-containing protein/NADP-dependent 3-hydroxy acid dehydrogenase YdfG